MSCNRLNLRVLVAIVITLAPASFVGAATRVVDIFIEASNFGFGAPVDPVLAGFEFKLGESLLTNGTGFVDNLRPTQAILNFGAFVPTDFRAEFAISDGVFVDTNFLFIDTAPAGGLIPGTDGFFYSGFESNTQFGNVRYTTSTTNKVFSVFNERGFPSGIVPDEVNIIVKAQGRASES